MHDVVDLIVAETYEHLTVPRTGCSRRGGGLTGDCPGAAFRAMLSARRHARTAFSTAALAVDPELVPGARNAIRDCLRLQPNERITIITDEATRDIAAALQQQVEEVGSDYAVFVLEEYAERPLTTMPRGNPRRSRHLAGLDLLRPNPARRARLAHADERRREQESHSPRPHGEHQPPDHARRDAGRFHGDRLAQPAARRARPPRQTRHLPDPGRDRLRGRPFPNLRWLKTSGIITPEKWGNLPGGEIFTSPFDSNGIFVVDGVVGDYLCQKYGDIQATPLTIEVKDNRIHSLACARLSPDLKVSVNITSGNPSQKIGEGDGGRHAPEPLVLGSHGHGGFKRWILGSVAETTVRYASCATLVVPKVPARSGE